MQESDRSRSLVGYQESSGCILEPYWIAGGCRMLESAGGHDKGECRSGQGVAASTGVCRSNLDGARGVS